MVSWVHGTGLSGSMGSSSERETSIVWAVERISSEQIYKGFQFIWQGRFGSLIIGCPPCWIWSLLATTACLLPIPFLPSTNLLSTFFLLAHFPYLPRVHRSRGPCPLLCGWASRIYYIGALCVSVHETNEGRSNERAQQYMAGLHHIFWVCQNMKQQEHRDDCLSVIRVATVDGAVVNGLISLISRWPPVQPDGTLLFENQPRQWE